MGAEVVNFGCRLNIAEGEAIRAAAAHLDGTTIVNSCAVTNEGVRKARQAVRRAARRGQRVIVTGCAAQLEPARFAAMPEVSGVIGNRDKRSAKTFSPHPLAGGAGCAAAGAGNSDETGPPRRFAPAPPASGWGELVSDIFAPAPPFRPVVSGAAHARAFVEVQTGCDHRCTFCIIPFARGNSASAPLEAVVEVVRAAVARGQREVVLTGVDVTSYEGGLGTLVERILCDVRELPRLRLSSLDPVEIDPLLFELITRDSRVMPHVHLSLQAGDNMILKRMKRRHSRGQAIALVERLKAARPEIAIGADLIAGFPTEDEAMTANSHALIDDCDIVFGHIFPFSPRDGTPAARMPQVPAPVARERAARLRAAVAARKASWLRSLVGTTQSVLIENDGRGGHAPNFARVDIAGTPGSVVEARIASTDGERLFA